MKGRVTWLLTEVGNCYQLNPCTNASVENRCKIVHGGDAAAAVCARTHARTHMHARTCTHALIVKLSTTLSYI